MSFNKWKADGNIKYIGANLYFRSQKICLGLVLCAIFCGAAEISDLLTQRLTFFDMSLSGQGHFFTSHLGNNMASVTWATKVSTNWVDQIDQLTDIFEGVSIFVVWLGRFAPFAK